uniref:Uncharacterized protein n=1 Tax=viral metagenome TaxID=1070528 RepID=A0A6C0HIL5_9ZZZZ
MLSAIEITEGFGKIMTGYLLVMDQSEIVRKSKYIDTILYNGANIVIHVFTMHVYSNQCLENIYKQCCSAYVCYLEYIEQLDKANLANNLYISDISIFVYKLTLGELTNNANENVDFCNQPIIDLVVKTWNTLLAWNSSISFNARLAICDIHLTKYAKLFHKIAESQVFLDYLGTIQEKWTMDDNVYFAFLNEYYRCLYKLHNANLLPDYSHVSEKILLFCIQYHLEDKPTEENIRSIVKRLVV